MAASIYRIKLREVTNNLEVQQHCSHIPHDFFNIVVRIRFVSSLNRETRLGSFNKSVTYRRDTILSGKDGPNILLSLLERMGAPLDYIRTLIVPSILSYARQIHSNPINSTRKLISFDVEVIIKVPVNVDDEADDDDDDEVNEPNDDDDDDGDALNFKPATYFSVQTLRRYKWGDDEEQDCLPLKKRRRLRGESHHAVVIHLHQPLQQNYRIPTCPLLQVRDHVTNLCINILLSYRKICATVSSTGQLILPEALKLLPLYTLALIKCRGLRNDGRIDDRFFWFNYGSSLSTPLAIPLVYPRMFAIHNVDTKDGDESVLPPTVPLSSEHVCDDGIYLLENGEDALIYFGSSVDSSILQQLFGFTSVDEVPTQFVMQQFSNPLSKNFNDVVNVIRQQRCSYLRFALCKKGDPSGMAFVSCMVEDKNANGPSYVEFLVHIHRQIQMKMS
ncbi:protein transport protein Sec24-like At4g32640 [Gossypium hirsutum]|uniref:Protein transport protein Sec24-like At4g32640 n=1 Tax=Gossypium hirsutum TaxID=3635 RepID=A0ABM3A178_GOSHI|nr:protein transport protein Sec24-like At4g32640 [Gossypium hirsutum]